MNLVNNAIKFTEHGKITVKTSLEKETDQQIIFAFSVTDTGIGISEDRLQALFKPFSQIDPSTTRRYGGTGLGLVISSSIIQMMGGAIKVDSTPEKGSSFHCTFCFEKATLNDQKNLEGAKEQEKSGSVAGLRGILAEDYPLNQKLAQILLEKMEISVTTANNGQEAVEEARKDEYDFILMDLQMPVMDGLEATKLLRNEKITIPIIALTANATAQDRAECLAAGMDDYLSKPIDKEKLRDVIFRQVKRQEKQQEFQQEEKMSRTGREDQFHGDSGQDKISSYL